MTGSPSDRFRELQCGYFDGELTPAEELELLELLDDPARREAFVSMCRINGDLARLATQPIPDDVMIARIMSQLEYQAPSAEPASRNASESSPPSSAGLKQRRFKLFWWGAGSAAVLAAAIFLLMVKRPEGNPVIASVIEVEGDVSIQSEAGALSLTERHPLRLGQGIVTGSGRSRVVVEYPDHTRVDVGPETSIAAFVEAEGDGSAPPRKRVHIVRGSVTVDAAKQPAGRPMVLVTPEAEIAVVGTRFSLETAEDGTQVRVAEGSVRMLRKVDQQTIDVPQGNYAVATPEIDRFVARPIAANAAGSIKLLPVARGVPLGHFGGVAALNFTGDGKWLVSGSLRGAPVRLWDLAGAKPSGPVEVPGHTAAVWSAQFSPDSKSFASGGVDRTVRLVRFEDRVTTAVLPHRDDVRAVAFSPDGKWLATGAHDSVLRLRDPASGDERMTCAENDRGGWSGIYSLAFSPDSKLIAIGLSDRRVRVRTVAQGEQVFLLDGHTDTVNSVAFSPDGRWLATASRHEAMIWDAATGRLARSINHSDPVVFSPDSRLLAVGDMNPSLVDVESGRTVALIEGHRGRVFSFAFQPGSNRLALGGWRGIVLLDIPSSDELCSSSR